MSKVITLMEAARFVQPGDTLALGGMTLYRRPVAFVRELLRAGTGDLTLLQMTSGLESDLLVGAGRVRRVRTCYFGLESFGLAPMFTQKAGAGEIEIIEETEASLACGLRATLAGVDFMPSMAWTGTDLLALRPDVKQVTSPYSGWVYTAFPALHVDVAVIHAHVSDRAGNAALVNNLGLDQELALAADRVIVTAERIVASPQELAHPLDIVEQRVTAVVELPRGAWPTSCFPIYSLDPAVFLAYSDACDRGQFATFLDHFLRDE